MKAAMLKRALMQTQVGNRQPELLDSPRPLLITGKGKDEQTFVTAVQHVLPELTKIDRYEKQAAGRRDRAIHELASMKNANKK